MGAKEVKTRAKRRGESPEEKSHHKKQDTRNKANYNVRIYRSKNDPTDLPIKLTPEWFTAQVMGEEGEFGLKTQIYGDVERFKEHLIQEILTPSLGQIRHVEHETFLKLHRIQQFEQQ